VWWVLPLLAAAAAPRAVVASDARCGAELSRALERSRAVELGAGEPELRISLRESTLTVARLPGGEVLLSRELGGQAGCREVAFAAVVVIERFLHGIELRPLPPLDAGAPPRARAKPLPARAAGAAEPIDAGAPEVEPEPDAGVDVAVAVEVEVSAAPAEPPPPPPRQPAIGVSPAPKAPLLTRIEVGVSGGLTFATTAQGLIALDASLFLRRFRVGALVHGGTSDRSPVVIGGLARGAIETQTFGAMLTAGACANLRVRACGALEGGAHLVRGSISGDLLFQGATGLQVRPAFGLRADVGWAPWRSLVLFVALSGVWSPTPAEFTIQGAPESTHKLPIFEGQLRLGAGWGLEP
jgi:hypothetical protein